MHCSCIEFCCHCGKKLPPHVGPGIALTAVSSTAMPLQAASAPNPPTTVSAQIPVPATSMPIPLPEYLRHPPPRIQPQMANSGGFRSIGNNQSRGGSWIQPQKLPRIQTQKGNSGGSRPSGNHKEGGSRPAGNRHENGGGWWGWRNRFRTGPLEKSKTDGRSTTNGGDARRGGQPPQENKLSPLETARAIEEVDNIRRQLRMYLERGSGLQVPPGQGDSHQKAAQSLMELDNIRKQLVASLDMGCGPSGVQPKNSTAAEINLPTKDREKGGDASPENGPDGDGSQAGDGDVGESEENPPVLEEDKED